MTSLRQAKERKRMLQTEQRKAELSKLMVRGYSVRGAAKEIGIDSTTCFELMNDIRREWVAEKISNTSELMAQQLAKLDELEQQAWEGWTRSLKDEVTRKRKRSKDANDAIEQTVEKAFKGQCGDSSFLNTIGKCIAERNKLLGLYPTQAGGGATVNVNLDGSAIPTDGDGNPIEQKPVFVVVDNRQQSMSFDQFFADMKLKTIEELRADQKQIIDGKVVDKQPKE
jgi:hypothetical protein